MRLSPKFILLISIVTAMLGFSLTMKTLNSITKPTALVATAQKDIKFGDVLESGDVQLIVAPKDADLNISFQQASQVVGKTARNSLRRGQVITTFDIVAEQDSLTGLIPEGYRAAAVPISLPQETLKNLRFGTRVDVLFADTSSKNYETRTIMKNVLVMRVDDNNSKKSISRNDQTYVTFAIKPEVAETLTYCVKRGKLDIALRPLSDKNVKEEFLTLDQLLGIGKNLGSAIAAAREVEVIRGTKKDKVKL